MTKLPGRSLVAHRIFALRGGGPDEVPLVRWQRALADACYSQCCGMIAGTFEGSADIVWIALAETILREVGDEALEATYRLGGQRALEIAVRDFQAGTTK